MKITKYPQSCLLVETKDQKILFDPGTIKYKDEYLNSWRQADAIFVTHKHSDHIHAEVLEDLNTPIYSTQEVQSAYPGLKINVVKENDKISLGDLSIEVVKAVHGYNPNLKNGNEVFENIGYILDDGETRLYVTSDTICFNNDYRADVVALPVTAHGLTMSSYEAALFANELGARLILPIHMDNEKYPTDLDYMRKNFAEHNINYQILSIEKTLIISS